MNPQIIRPDRLSSWTTGDGEKASGVPRSDVRGAGQISAVSIHQSWPASSAWP